MDHLNEKHLYKAHMGPEETNDSLMYMITKKKHD